MDRIIDLVLDFHTSSYTMAAAITLWAYDYLLTLLDEIELVWEKPNVSWTKLLFFANRNLPILHAYFIGQLVLPTRTVASKQDCDAAVAMITIGSLLQVFVIHIIFTMRIYTLSHSYPQFQILLIATLVISQGTSTVLAALNIQTVLPSFAYFPQGHTCIYLKPAENLYSALLTIISIALETLIFAATIFHTIRYQRKILPLEGARSISILRRLSLHGGQFYALVILSHVSTILSLYLAPLGLQILVPTFNYFFTSSLVSRFVLSLQREIIDSKRVPPESSIRMTGPAITFTRTPITFLYSEHRFGGGGSGGSGSGGSYGNYQENGFGPETFISMESLRRCKQKEAEDEEEPDSDKSPGPSSKRFINC